MWSDGWRWGDGVIQDPDSAVRNSCAEAFGQIVTYGVAERDERTFAWVLSLLFKALQELVRLWEMARAQAVE